MRGSTSEPEPAVFVWKCRQNVQDQAKCHGDNDAAEEMGSKPDGVCTGSCMHRPTVTGKPAEEPIHMQTIGATLQYTTQGCVPSSRWCGPTAQCV